MWFLPGLTAKDPLVIRGSRRSLKWTVFFCNNEQLPDCLQSWALAEAAQGDTELARQMLQKATVVQPRSVPCWHAWAKLELTAGNSDKARELYLKALELNPKNTVTQSAPLTQKPCLNKHMLKQDGMCPTKQRAWVASTANGFLVCSSNSVSVSVLCTSGGPAYCPVHPEISFKLISKHSSCPEKTN